MNYSNIKLVPLGGCGEIGMNMTILHIDECAYFIDCGALFSDGTQIGVDIIYPSTNYLDENKITPTAWLITHGHEDHIGALTYMFKKYPAPIYGTRFTIELIKGKFADASLLGQAKFVVWNYFESVILKYLKVIPFPVNHSIADAAGLFMETPGKNILHMGDFRIDYDPPEKSMTHENLAKVIEGKTVDLMMSDSTNSFSVGTDKSESLVYPHLKNYFINQKGAIIIATFSSNIWRLKSVMQATRETGRKLALFGRSMLKNMAIAKELNFVHYDPKVLLEFSQLKQVDRNNVCILCTGSQGEPFSGLHRLTWGQVPEFEICKDDLVIFSSRMIPGNEKSIDEIITQLTKIGATVVTGKDDVVHVSGHGFSEDLKTCIRIAKPKAFMPVHGTYKHLKRHRELAIECGVPENKSFIVENGDVFVVGPKTLGVTDKVFAGRDYSCPGGVFGKDSPIYKERVNLAWSGVVCYSFLFNSYTTELMCDPTVQAKGIKLESKIDLVKIGLRSFETVVNASRGRSKISDIDFMREELKNTIRRSLEQILKYKCVVIVLLTKLG